VGSGFKPVFNFPVATSFFLPVANIFNRILKLPVGTIFKLPVAHVFKSVFTVLGNMASKNTVQRRLTYIFNEAGAMVHSL